MPGEAGLPAPRTSAQGSHSSRLQGWAKRLTALTPLAVPRAGPLSTFASTSPTRLILGEGREGGASSGYPLRPHPGAGRQVCVPTGRFVPAVASRARGQGAAREDSLSSVLTAFLLLRASVQPFPGAQPFPPSQRDLPPSSLQLRQQVSVLVAPFPSS